MPRPIAFSAKQKREQLQDKRAVQRGELEPSQVRYARNPAGNYRPGANHLPHPASANTAATRLISQFTSLTPEYVERSRYLAHTLPLIRPISGEAAVFELDWMERDGGRLSCPVRPGFEMGQAKEEVERREQETYGLWLKETMAIVEEWVERGEKEGQDEGAEVSLLSPTWFETNLEVWRQLWRVSESSHILLLLADARCPVLHLPASLRSYVQGLQPRKEVIVVLTKCDLVEPEALAGWKAWVVEWWSKGGSDADASERGEIQVITVQSFEDRWETSGPSKIVPDLPQESSKQLIEALRVAHDRLQLESPLTTSLPMTSKRQCPVRTDVDWEALARYPTSSQASQGPSSSPERDASTPSAEEADGATQLEPLTIGLIGQPNVGKSSLLNAVLGESRVRVGRAPGKTKHFQTIFWGQKKEVKFVDCPGLVCPSLVGFELQALCGVLPISQIPSLFACISTAARLAPLEQIFSVPQPIEPEEKDEYADKRTWREPRPQERVEEEVKSKPELTAWQIIEGRAIDRGYRTAKTGRPDINRAATGMMLALAEGKVRWCFFPPGSVVEREGRGIWSVDASAADDERSRNS